jgi:hypothetical protein
MKHSISIVAVAALMLAAPALAADLPANFTGGTSTDWNIATNWDTGVVPTIAYNEGGQITVQANAVILLGATTPDIGGVLSVQSGNELIINADFGHAPTETNRDVQLQGTITQNAGDVYFSDDTRPSGGGTYNMNGGTFVNRDYWRFDSAGTINITGGEFTIGGYLQMKNGGSDPATLKVVGDAADLISLGSLTSFSAATLDIVFKDGGITTIDVTGGADLPGTLNVSVDSGSFVGDYTIISAGSLSGTIGTENLPAGWSVATVGNDLIVTAIPEPATMSLFALGGLAMLRRRRRA